MGIPITTTSCPDCEVHAPSSLTLAVNQVSRVTITIDGLGCNVEPYDIEEAIVEVIPT